MKAENPILLIYCYFEKHPWVCRLTLFSVLVLFTFSIIHLHFTEDISSFLPDTPENHRMNEAYSNIGSTNKLMVTVTPLDTGVERKVVMQAVDAVAARIEETDTLNLIKDVFYNVDESKITEIMHFMIKNMPYYLSDSDYARIDTLIESEKIRNILEEDKNWLISPVGSWMKNFIAVDPLHFSANAISSLQNIQQSDAYQTIDGYIFDKKGNEAIMAVSSKFPVSETKNNKLLVEELQNAIDDVEKEYKSKVDIDCIGTAIISIGNADRIKKDSIISTSLALLLIIALLYWFFKDIKAMLLLLFSICFGALFALAFISLFQNTVSIIAIGVGSIIVGIAVNYPLHFLAHCEQGYSCRQTIRDIVGPLVIGNITTVGAFLSLLFINSDAMKDLGLFVAMLLVGTILFVLIFLPHLFSKSLFAGRKASISLKFGKIAEFDMEKYPVIVVIVLLLTIPLYFLSRNTAFETNMNAINYMTPEHRAKIQRLTKQTESTYPRIYCVSEGESMQNSLEKYEEALPYINDLKREGKIVKISGLGNFIPSKSMQIAKIEKWNEFWKDRKEPFLKKFQSEVVKAGFIPEAFGLFEDLFNKNFHPEEVEYFEPLINSFAENYISEEGGKSRIYTLIETTEASKSEVSSVLNGISSEVFTFDNFSMMSKMIDALSEDFDFVLYACGIIVFIFLTLSFGRIELSITAFIPLTLAWIWILGLMYIFDIRFNIVNIILATFIFGMGDDYTIFVTEGLMYEYTYGKKMLASYKNSVLFSAIIMFIGIGALILAKHPAMRSLAEVTIIGMFSVVLMAYFFPPLVYRWLTVKKGKYRKRPVTLIDFFRTMLSLTCFIIGLVSLNMVGFFLITLGGRTASHEKKFHKILNSFLRLLTRLLPSVEYHFDNQTAENFETPGVIISNHQSHIDLLYILALNPNIICLTNNKVWNSPFYRQIIRYARYYPISEGFENIEESIKKAIDDGYSVLIFPEGTRSEKSKLLRFHQGAFQLAETCKVDIIPILIHGAGDVFPKGEFMLHKGRVDLKILPRIKSGDNLRSGKKIRQIAHEIRLVYERELRKMSDSIETPSYFSDLVMHNYIYKGREIGLRARNVLRKHNNFEEEISALPDSGTYVIENCGQGEFALMSALVKKDLQIIAEDSNEDLVKIAANCVSVPKNLIYKYVHK